jgi:glutathione S-transferase
MYAVSMGRVPVLTVDGTYEIGQSKSIERYVAKKFGFMGDTLEEEGKIDMISEHVRDLRQKYNDARAGKSGDEATAAKLAFLTHELPKWFTKLEKVVEGEKYSVGSKLSLADVTIQQFILDYVDNKAAMLDAVAHCPKLLSIASNVQSLARGWIESRPVTTF